MSLKIKLITSISAFFLVLALLVTGVFAARNLEFSFGGTINFEGVNGNVDALITAEVTGTATPVTLDDISIEQGDTEVTVPESWKNIDFTVLNEVNFASGIIFSITIQNRREDRNLVVDLSVLGLDTNEDDPEGNVYGGFNDGFNLSNSEQVTIQPNQSSKINCLINPKSNFISVNNVDVSFTISFQDAE